MLYARSVLYDDAFVKGFYFILSLSLAGTYNNVTGLYNSSACQPCSPGYYCMSGTIVPHLRCTAGHWCKGGSYEAAPVGQTYGVKCPPGSYCPENIPFPIKCPNGTYQPSEGKTQFEDCKGK